MSHDVVRARKWLVSPRWGMKKTVFDSRTVLGGRLWRVAGSVRNNKQRDARFIKALLLSVMLSKCVFVYAGVRRL